MEAIQTKELTKKYKNLVAVDKLSLTVREGTLFSLLGVNGAGKTTTLKMLTTLTRPTSGDALIFGKSLCQNPSWIKTQIGVSPQETAIAPGLSVWENLELLCGLHGMGTKEQKNRSEQLISLFHLEKHLTQKAGKLSGGWQRRLSLAMALVNHPKLLFLDEPTLGLDVLARSELWEIIQKLKGETTIILTTHYMEEAETLSDEIGILKDGHLVTVGSAEELKRKTGEKKFENAFIALVKGGDTL
jgi:ABC-2 type transport system ATP-binding protein